MIKEFSEFLEAILKTKEKILILSSIGFDKRGIKTLETLNNYQEKLDIDFLIINYEKDFTRDEFTVKIVEENRITMEELLPKERFTSVDVNALADSNHFLNQIKSSFTEKIVNFNPGWIIIDIGVMPRDFFYALVGFCFDFEDYKSKTRIAVINTEYTRLEYEPDRSEYQDPDTLHGYDSPEFSEPMTTPRDLSIWIPILGKDMNPIIKIMDEWQDFPLIFPVLPFPCVYPYDSDEILLANKYLFEGRGFLYENILHTPYMNPFEVAKEIGKLVEELNKIFRTQNTKLTFYISPYGSKLQNVGACLAAIKHRLCILYSKPGTYEIDEKLEEPDLSECKVYLLNP